MHQSVAELGSLARFVRGKCVDMKLAGHLERDIRLED
jgi:hypothetical protein